MYLAARAWGIQPSEFWDMTMVEWFAEADLRHGTDEAKPQRGKLSPDEAKRLKMLLEDD